MAICGEEGGIGQQSRRWATHWYEGGTTVGRMFNFIEDILDSIGMAAPGNWFCFTMDNLAAHKNEAVVALIHGYGHGVAYRAPYYAVDGAIEYVFNTLQTSLRSKMHNITEENIIQCIYQSIQSIDNFSPYFRNVGFIRN